MKHKLIKFFGGKYEEGGTTWVYRGELTLLILTIRYNIWKRCLGVYYNSKIFYLKTKIKILSFFDRNYNLILNKQQCVSIVFEATRSDWDYNSLLTSSEGVVLRSLGNNWYKIIKTK